ncbi:MAG: hypothetical protein NW216_06865 [Hyphomicrobium sp.]|nr:hypothetical protein [Hyphomicrobium sp.]
MTNVSSTSQASQERVGVVLIHGIGDTEPGWSSEKLVKRLKKCSEPPAFSGHTEVFDLEDPLASGDKEFPAHVRRATSSRGRTLSFIEFHWADLSRVGNGAIEGWLATLQLFYEAPQVLGECFFDWRKNGLSRMIGALLWLANVMLRWPITGLNTAAFVVAIALLLRQKAAGFTFLTPVLNEHLPLLLAGILVLLAGAAWRFSRSRVDRDIALADIGMSTAIFAGLMAVAILVVRFAADPAMLDNPALYLMVAGRVILAAWIVWNYAVLFAIFLFLILMLHHAVMGGADRRLGIARAAAAIGLSLIQGVIYKVSFAILWVLILMTLDFNERSVPQCVLDPLGTCQFLVGLKNNLAGIVVFNLIMLTILATAYALVASVRALMRLPARRIQKIDAVPMPRMIVSPLIIAVLMAGTIFNLIIFYWRNYIPVDLYRMVDVSLLPIAETMIVLVGGTTALSFAFSAFSAMQNASRGILRIVRDIVDHQYEPRLPFSRANEHDPSRQALRHPRRERVAARLEVLLNEIVVREKCDRLVLVAHSQGSVILYDYLRAHRNDPVFRDVREIDILTLGSPLSYIYRHYFETYDRAAGGFDVVGRDRITWTNMWRIDDPIGNRIVGEKAGVVANVPLRPGGHLDYWKDTGVQEAILALIDPERKGPHHKGGVAADGQVTA